ncbi:capsular biosynthesis protein [Burkholderia multivorans]|uniref:capsule biosynthesis protein n=1 Tax=Burkholderia multivorans TaxID=87883 RepID=UPI000CFF4ECA|nr:capsular biosynthesis protein [Burkholderia multivorans]AYY96420.1 capsular biosynthesis protein [Burkholderia multivorans]MBU9120262.1 capsular biosynthesis protein [Burkholderia multivorans]PRF47055.1 capsular biosynthesis protein [Burkholderia multivorans]PRG48633.1 capsular biosynthesis protein [Burkholderia multivorans]
MRRSFLALQGTASPFFGRLGDALRDRGHRVCKVNFCGGDVAYSGSVDVLNYRDSLDQLPEWYGELVRRGDFTDVVMFGDCREVHRHMHAVSQAAQLAVHVFEEGYVRPYWITLERHGVNGRSLLPRDPAWYLAQRGAVPHAPDAHSTGYNLYERAFHDICYRAANSLYARRFPQYRSHRPKNGLVEYAGLAYRALQQRRHRQHADDVTRELLRAGRAYYLFPLQLNSDAQIVEHSPFGGICDAITQVMRSFASEAPSDALLVIKNHPLDTGLIDYRKHVKQLAAVLGIPDRIRFIDSGHLPTLLEHARGVVVVNSTVGLSALHHHRPLIALGTAIYNMAGLTWQGTLADFWYVESGPDPVLYQAFLDCVVHYTQVNGDFYTRTGIEMATVGAIRRLEAHVG